MDETLRHARAYRFFRALAAPFLKLWYRYSYDPIPAGNAPYFLVCNHTLDMDPILLGVAAPQHTYFVATENILRKGPATRFLMRYFKPIIHTKGKAGLRSSMEILRTLKAGHSVALFPEGNRSFNGLTGPIFPATGKLARRSGTALITYRIEGGYFTQPRWSLSTRRGRLRGRLVHVYTPEELAAMRDEEVIAAIENDLKEDAYETQQQKHIAFRGRRLARGLESALFTCPACRHIGTLHSLKDRIRCDCGFTASYDVYGDLTDGSGERRTVRDWDLWQRRALKELWEAAAPGQPLFADDVTIRRIADHAVQDTFSARITAFRDHFTVNDTVVSPDAIEGSAIFSRNVLTVHTDAQYEIRGAESFCALKYQYLLQLIGKEP